MYHLVSAMWKRVRNYLLPLPRLRQIMTAMMAMSIVFMNLVITVVVAIAHGEVIRIVAVTILHLGTTIW